MLRGCGVSGAFSTPAEYMDAAEWARENMLHRHKGGQDDYWRVCELRALKVAGQNNTRVVCNANSVRALVALVHFIRSHFPEEPALTWVEIGTAFGMTTDYVLSRLPKVTAHAVDPCVSAYDPADDTARQLDKFRMRAPGRLSRAAFSMAWAGALVAQQEHRLDQHGCPRYYHHRSHSTAAAVDFADASIDVLFVDGLHTYAGALADLVAYWPKLKARSLLILNDWSAPSCACRGAPAEDRCGCAFPGVKRAGCAFLASKGLETRIVVEGPVGPTNAAVVLGMASRAPANRTECEGERWLE